MEISINNNNETIKCALCFKQSRDCSSVIFSDCKSAVLLFLTADKGRTVTQNHRSLITDHCAIGIKAFAWVPVSTMTEQNIDVHTAL